MVLWVLAVAVAVAASKQAVLELALRSNEEGQLETSFSLGKSEVRGTSG
jgi:ABC-type arginine/histidine transport system permease subunit